MTTRTPEQIVERICARKPDDFFGFEITDYLIRLPFAQAKEFLKPDAPEEGWKIYEKPPLEELREYMDFAWDKANNNRGISASRSVAHCRAWLWLAGREDVGDILEDHHKLYGKPWEVR